MFFFKPKGEDSEKYKQVHTHKSSKCVHKIARAHITAHAHKIAFCHEKHKHIFLITIHEDLLSKELGVFDVKDVRILEWGRHRG